MMSSKGRAFLLKMQDDSAYFTKAGLRETACVIAESSFSLEARGIFLGSAAEAHVRALALSGATEPMELSYEDGEKLRAPFKVARLDYAGDLNGERNYTFRLVSTAQGIEAAQADETRSGSAVGDSAVHEVDAPHA